jgi:hypothetical protein
MIAVWNHIHTIAKRVMQNARWRTRRRFLLSQEANGALFVAIRVCNGRTSLKGAGEVENT